MKTLFVLLSLSSLFLMAESWSWMQGKNHDQDNSVTKSDRGNFVEKRDRNNFYFAQNPKSGQDCDSEGRRCNVYINQASEINSKAHDRDNFYFAKNPSINPSFQSAKYAYKLGNDCDSEGRRCNVYINHASEINSKAHDRDNFYFVKKPSIKPSVPSAKDVFKLGKDCDSEWRRCIILINHASEQKSKAHDRNNFYFVKKPSIKYSFPSAKDALKLGKDCDSEWRRCNILLKHASEQKSKAQDRVKNVSYSAKTLAQPFKIKPPSYVTVYAQEKNVYKGDKYFNTVVGGTFIG